MDWVKMLTAFLTVTAIVLVVLIVVAIFLSPDSGTDPADFAVKRGEEIGGPVYFVLEIEGMTCIWIKTPYSSDSGVGGLTCNWDEWRK